MTLRQTISSDTPRGSLGPGSSHDQSFPFQKHETSSDGADFPFLVSNLMGRTSIPDLPSPLSLALYARDTEGRCANTRPGQTAGPQRQARPLSQLSQDPASTPWPCRLTNLFPRTDFTSRCHFPQLCLDPCPPHSLQTA